MKLCDTCIYRNNVEQLKPCIIYRDNCEYYEKERKNMADDFISRDMALEKMTDYVASGYADSVKDFEEYSRIICQLPPVNPQEPKTGRWKYGYAFPDGNYCKCSECKEIIKCIYPMHYCPNCGCRMIEPQESEDEE